MVKTGRVVDLEPIERLEEKVKLLVALISRLRAEQARATEENGRLTRELEAARLRVRDVEAASAETAGLKEERDLIRARVSEMLAQLEALNL
jgi:FtsZ-binding cell division protein ZapB